jgi:hypothetical protein
MGSFDLKQFLVENKLTENSKLNEARIVPSSTGVNISKTLFADFNAGSNDNSINSRFARTISELLNFEYSQNTLQGTYTIDSIFNEEGMDDVKDGDEFFAGPTESLAFFQKLPPYYKFIVTHNINGDNESFEVTKIGSNSFNAKEIYSKLNEVRIVPKTHNFEKIATDLINQYQPDWEPGDENLSITNEIPISEVNPRFVKYLKSLPSESPNFSGTAFFEILYNGHKYGVQFYILYDEDVVVFEI